MQKIILIFFILLSQKIMASALIDLNYIMFTDKNTVETDTSTTSTKSLYNVGLGFSIDAKKSFYFGWGIYNVLTKDDVNQQKNNYSTQDMGPYFRYEFGKKMYFLGLTYGIQTKTAFDTGGTSEEWLSTNYLVQLGINPEIADGFCVNFVFNYFSGSTKKKVISDVQTDVTYSKAFMSPSIGLSYKW